MNDTVPAPDPANALIAFALDADAPGVVSADECDKLVDFILADQKSRVELISLVKRSQDDMTKAVVLELLGGRLDSLQNSLTELDDRDQIGGVWSQRITGGVVLALGGFVLTGALSGLYAGLALAAAFVGCGFSFKYRTNLRSHRRKYQRSVTTLERLIEHIKS